MVRIAVIGAGAVGLSSAVNVQASLPDAQVTIVADQFEHETTSFGVAGSYRPALGNLVNEHNGELIKKCLRDSWARYSYLAQSPDAGEAGAILAPTILGHRKSMDYDYSIMKECCFDFHRLSESEMEKRSIPKIFKYTYACDTVIMQPSIYLKWLMKTFKSKGGQVQRRKVKKLQELYGEFDLVVNCCGLGALTLLDDKECYPTRGQLVYTQAPWIKTCYYFDTEVQVFPHQDRVVIGGIREHHNPDISVDSQTTESIVKKAQDLIPSLKGAKVTSAWAASRPSRSELRLETEILDLGPDTTNRRLPVVHNYGHGGNGITLSWGTAVHAAQLVKRVLSSSGSTSTSTPTSKSRL